MKPIQLVSEKQKSDDEMLARIVARGKKERYSDVSLLIARSFIEKRINYELSIIRESGLAHLYITMSSILRWAKMKGIGIGLGYGAMASSTVCYCLQITDVDPWRYNLCSARFVNERVPTFTFEVEKERVEEFREIAESLFKAAHEEKKPYFHCDLLKVVPMEYPAKLKNVKMPLRGFSGLGIKRILQKLCNDEAGYCWWYGKTGRDALKQFRPRHFQDLLNFEALYRPCFMDLMPIVSERMHGNVPKESYSLHRLLNPTFGEILFQEQIMGLLHEVFGVGNQESNQLRIQIQCRQTRTLLEICPKLFENSYSRGYSKEEARRIWEKLISVPQEVPMKAHSLCRVMTACLLAMSDEAEKNEFVLH